ncbi:hypothetical protein DPMN_150221 [Dreissena polymorpha]|uniref:Uncharacterized protein n=1 Tax=Dreissena polymorpha TaxID=45954 RepID=A0A9D4FIX3_DREPO|nr:hypothetical protein DPMN_150221 [Dreissena polymorpha]
MRVLPETFSIQPTTDFAPATTSQEKTTLPATEMTTTMTTTDEFLMSTLNQLLNSNMMMLRDLESIRH